MALTKQTRARWIALLALTVPAAAIAGRSQEKPGEPPEIEDYCKYQAMPSMLDCGKECEAAFGSALASDLGSKCQAKCFERHEKQKNACIQDAARTLSSEFLNSSRPDIDGYCARIYQEIRTVKLATGFPSVMADEGYEKDVAKCTASVVKRLGNRTRGRERAVIAKARLPANVWVSRTVHIFKDASWHDRKGDEMRGYVVSGSCLAFHESRATIGECSVNTTDPKELLTTARGGLTVRCLEKDCATLSLTPDDREASEVTCRMLTETIDSLGSYEVIRLPDALSITVLRCERLQDLVPLKTLLTESRHLPQE